MSEERTPRPVPKTGTHTSATHLHLPLPVKLQAGLSPSPSPHISFSSQLQPSFHEKKTSHERKDQHEEGETGLFSPPGPNLGIGGLSSTHLWQPVSVCLSEQPPFLLRIPLLRHLCPAPATAPQHRMRSSKFQHARECFPALPWRSWQMASRSLRSLQPRLSSLLHFSSGLIYQVEASNNKRSDLDRLVQQVPLLYSLLLLQCQERRTGILKIFPTPSLPGYSAF